MVNTIPLAERLRPKTIKEVIGQNNITHNKSLLTNILKTKKLFNLIFWGPPGSGKTTLARIIANNSEADFIELSAVSSGKADISKVIERAQQNKRLAIETILFVDEIHRFNKAQQDIFLPYLEDGTIFLIGATTENPSFEIISPLLSRSRVIVLEALSKEALLNILIKACHQLKISENKIDQKSLKLIAEISNGDARRALNTLELALDVSENKKLTPEIVTSTLQKQPPLYDKQGDNHYDFISAFIKSMRGGDLNATLYYLARMLKAGEDPKFIVRLMIIFASEDIGIAASAALNLTISTFLAVERIGMPEAEYNIFHCATVLAKSPKSRDITTLMNNANSIANQHSNLAVPLHLRNASTSLMKDLGYGQGTKWEKGFKHPLGFLPKEIQGLDLLKTEE